MKTSLVASAIISIAVVISASVSHAQRLALPTTPRSTPAPAPAPVRRPPLVITSPVNLTMEPGCTTVSESQPPFAVTKNTLQGQAQGNQRQWVAGYFPKNTLVKLNEALPQGGIIDNVTNYVTGNSPMVSVTALNVPAELTNLDANGVRQGTGAVTSADAGQGQRIRQGQTGYIKASDLNASAPGSTVFLVQKDTPWFDIPELEGRAARLAQNAIGNYLTKRCCPAGVQTETWIERGRSMMSRHFVESARDSRCTYVPVFELLRNEPINGRPNFVKEKEFAIGHCNQFLPGLMPIDRNDLGMVFGVARSVAPGSGVSGVSPQNLARLQRMAWGDAIEPRCLGQSGANCRMSSSGNFSRGKCRTAVRESLKDLGWLRNHPPGVHAHEMAPWLATQGFVDVTAQYGTAENAPLGATIVYEGGPSGHIEIKVDRDSYCSDHCNYRPISQYLARRVKAIYLPPRGT